MIHFACASCGTSLSAPEECVGRGTKCRQCGHPVTVPAARDKTTLGALISHTPTGVKPDALTTTKGPANAPALPVAKVQKPAKGASPSRKNPAPPQGRSGPKRVGVYVAGILLIFLVGGLFGYAMFRHLDAGKADKDSGGEYTQGSDQRDGYQQREPVAPSRPGNGPKEETTPPPSVDNQPVPPVEPRPTPPRREEEETPPKREETPVPPPAKEESPTPPRKEEPPPPPKEDPPAPPMEEPPTPPPAKEEPPATPPRETPPPPPKEEPPAPPKREGPKPDERLQSLIAALQDRKQAERLDAAEALGQMGQAARPAAQALCEALAKDASSAVRQAALTALEQISPELHKPLVTLLVGAEAQKHQAAAREIARLGADGRAAAPVLLAHLGTASARFQREAPAVVSEDVRALAQIAPDDPAVQKALLAATKMTIPAPRSRRDIGQPARQAAVQSLGELVQRRPEQAKHILPGLISATRTMSDADVRRMAVGLLGTIAENHADLRPRVAAALIQLLRKGELTAIPQLAKCGRDAKDAVSLLKQLKLHPVEGVRTAAGDALARIEDALASAATPPRKEGPPPDKEEPPVTKEPEDPSLPARLRSIIARLKSGTTEERVKAAEELSKMGETAQPAARALCEAALSPSQKVSRAALDALKQVHPDLAEPVFVLLIDAKAINHRQALTKLGLLGDRGKAATPVLFHEIKRCQELLSDRQAAWGQSTLVTVITDTMKTLTKVAPEDPAVVKTLAELTTFTVQQRFGRPIIPFRRTGVQLLGELAEVQPQHRKQIMPSLVSVLKESVQNTKSSEERQVLFAIQEVELAGNALLKCGPAAKETIDKEVLPRLKDLQFHRSDNVRKTAEALRNKIEDAP